MKWISLTVFLSISLLTISLQAQDELSNALIKGLGDSGAKKKAKLDSIDFQFTISINQNAGFFDVENKGEGGARFLYAMRDRKDKTTSEIARDTLDFALGLYNARMYKLAEISFLDAKNFMENNGLTNDISYLRCISNMAVVYLVQGRTIEAEQFINYALEESRNMMGPNSAAYAANLNSRAKLDQFLGKYNEAEKSFDESGVLVKKIFGANTMQDAILLNNKAMLYQAIGRYEEAVTLMKQAITSSEAAPKKALQGKKSFDNRKFQSNLALMLQLSGKLPEAETTFLGIKKIFENRGQTNNPEYASLLNQLSSLYIQMSKLDQVEELLKKSSAVYKKKFTEENPSFAKVQSDLGNFYRIQGRMTEAETTLLKAKDIQQRTLGENHPDYVKSVEDVGIMYWKKGELDKAYAFLREATNKSLDFIDRYFPPMSESEKAKYWDVLHPRFQRFYNYAIEASATNPAIVKDVYDYQIATKALLLNSTNKIKKAILASGDQSLINDYLAWISQKEVLARYYALSKEELKQQNIDLPSLEKNANNLERALSQRSGDFNQGYRAEKVDYKKIASLLGDTEAIVEIIRIHNYDKDFTTEARYAILIITKGLEVPKLIVLDNGTQLDTRYAKFYKNSIMQKSEDTYSYDQYWARLEPALTGKKILYVSPDGVYNQLNINTLKKPGANYVLTNYDVTIIGNSKDLIAIKSRKTGIAKKDAFLLGFPDYGGNAVALPGTKVELEGINKILKAAAYQTKTYQQKEATEKNLKELKGPSLMHIATHGYFLADADVGTGSAMGVDADNAKNNPLLRSGLILAGVQSQQSNATPDLQSNDNGILTAYEAMNLNLEGTDLIVLSACETGLGELKAGEGVYGLQRAFLVAGANALIMSLWKVDDEATQFLMTNFYTNWVKTNNKQKAFKQAQLQLMTKYKEPYYWGAFVMMGQ